MQTATPTKLLTIPQLCARHPGLTIGAVRAWLFNRETNGLSRAVFKPGKRVYVDEPAFLAWIADQSGHAKGGE